MEVIRDDSEKSPPPGSIWATCKECDKVYAYSISSARADTVAGRSAPERCREHAGTHKAEIESIGVAHFTARGRDGGPVPMGISTGRLGKIHHPPREHIEIPANPIIDEEVKGSGVSDQNLDDLFAALSQRQVILVEGGTGSGKSTYVPCRLVEPGNDARRALWTPRGPIVITQPRIQATVAIPERVAELLGCGVGQRLDVGYKYGGADESDLSRNRLVFMTDGILLNWLLDGARLDQIAAVMIDEAHERSLNIDVILALLKRILPRYPHLKLLIASATINTASFRDFFGDTEAGSDTGEGTILDAAVPVIRCAARQAGYEHAFREETTKPKGPLTAYDAAIQNGGEVLKSDAPRLTRALVDKITQVLAETSVDTADILGFVATQAQVEDACQQLADTVRDDPRMAHVEILPLHRKLPEQERKRASGKKEDPTVRRVIIATNIAETSLTITELDYIVDSGIIIQPVWDDTEEEAEYPTVLHSQAGCQQRWGRVGRVRPGRVWTLYTERQYEAFPEHTIPAVKRSRMDDVVMKVKAAGFEPGELDWLSEPHGEAVKAAAARLEESAALTAEGHLTNFGLEMQRLGLGADEAKLMIEADRFACSIEMATLLAMRGREALANDHNWSATRRVRAARAHRALRGGLKDDLELLLKIFAGWHGEFDLAGEHDSAGWSARWFVNHQVMLEAQKARADLLRHFSGHGKEKETRAIDFSILERLRVLLAHHLPRRVFTRQNGAYVSPDGEAAKLSDDSCVPAGEPAVVLLQTQLRSSARLIKEGAIVPGAVGGSSHGLLNSAAVMAEQLRDGEGALLHDADETWRRILVDQLAPPGARFRSAPAGDGSALTLGERVVETPQESGSRTERKLPREDEAKSADHGPPVNEEGTYLSDEGEDPPPNIPPDDEEGDRDAGPPAARARLLWKTVPVAAELQGDAAEVKEGTVEIVGYARDDRRPPRTIVRPSPADQFSSFAEDHAVGSAAELEIVGVEAVRYRDDVVAVLVTRDVTSGLEVLLDSEEVVLDGFGWVLENLKPGTRVTAEVTAIDPELREVRATLLPAVIRHRQALFAGGHLAAVATIGNVPGPYPRYVEAWLEGVSKPDEGILQTVRITAAKLSRNVRQYSVGQRLHVDLWLTTGSVEYPAQTQELDVSGLHESLHYDDRVRKLTFNGQMSFEEYREMADATSSVVLSFRLHELLRESNRLRSRERDAPGDDEFLERFPVGSDVEVRVTHVEPSGVGCRMPDGRQRRIARADLDWDHRRPVGDIATAGQNIKARVLQDGAGFKLSVKALQEDPLLAVRRACEQDEILEGTVVSFNVERGLVLELGSVEVPIAWKEVPNGNHDARSRFPLGGVLKVRVVSVDMAARSVEVTGHLHRAPTPAEPPP